MSNLTKSEIVHYVLDCIIGVVGKRKSDLYAITTLAEIVEQLKPKYDFLQYLTIDTDIFSETWIAVQVDQQIETIEEEMLGKIFSEIIERLSKSFEGPEDYYIIREIRDDLKYETETILKKFGVDLNLKQFEYAIFKGQDKKNEIIKITNSDILKQIIGALLKAFKNIYPKDETVKMVKSYLHNLEIQYDFLKNIQIEYIPMAKEFYTIILSLDIDTIPPVEIGSSIERLLFEIGTSVSWSYEPSFTDSIKKELLADDLKKLNKMGIDFDLINRQLKSQKHTKVTQNVFEALFKILIQRTSEESALKTLGTTLQNLQNNHEVFDYIKINPLKSNDEANVIQIMPEINSIESYKLGKAFRETIKIVHDIFGDKTFISDFKKEIGEECLHDIENMGVNLHFLELRFA